MQRYRIVSLGTVAGYLRTDIPKEYIFLQCLRKENTNILWDGIFNRTVSNFYLIIYNLFVITSLGSTYISFMTFFIRKNYNGTLDVWHFS